MPSLHDGLAPVGEELPTSLLGAYAVSSREGVKMHARSIPCRALVDGLREGGGGD